VELAVVKETLLAAAASAGGFDTTDVDRIELKQNDIAIGRLRRANGPITARIVFKDNAIVDVEATITNINIAIKQGVVTVEMEVNGKMINATVTEAAVGVAATRDTTLTSTKSASLQTTAETTVPIAVLFHDLLSRQEKNSSRRTLSVAIVTGICMVFFSVGLMLWLKAYVLGVPLPSRFCASFIV
jgi:hypothetical protein